MELFNLNYPCLVEYIYKQKLLDMRQYCDAEIDNVVKSVRTEAEAALANLRRNPLGKSTGVTANT